MSNPIAADNKPAKIELKKGESKWWCACGLSKAQPFCDGSHKSTDIIPKEFKAEKDGDVYMCNCKKTGNAPYCDGSHKDIKEEDVGKEVELNSGMIDPLNVKSTREEPTMAKIKAMAKNGLEGHHGEMVAMGVPRVDLPEWDSIQIMVAQMATKPLMDNANVNTQLIIGPRAKKPLVLDKPIFVSDMSFGALSEEAKIALAKGAQLAGTGICSGEGGMLSDEQEANSKYFYELASAKFGFEWDKLKKVQAFHFKGGQGAKTGTGGHLPGAKVTGKIAEVRGLNEGEDAISPPTFKDLVTVDDFKNFADKVRDITGGIPIGFKLSANHIERDIQFAVDASADYIILDGRGGGTGAAPSIFRDHISVPTIPALARARKYLDKIDRKDITLIITGGLRLPEDFIKAMALGANGVAISNSAMQAIGCIAARMCNSNNCPVGVATQNMDLRKRLNIEKSAQQLANFFEASTSLMQVMARACGHDDLQKFNQEDIATWNRDMYHLTGIHYAGNSVN